jgi:hypothetical protein
MQEIKPSGLNNLLAKILNGTATREEIITFSQWIKHYNNEAYFDKFKEMWHVSVDNIYKKSNAFHNNPGRFIEYMRMSKRRAILKRGLISSISAAASIALLFGIYNIWMNDNLHRKPDLTALKYSKDSVRVELNNGEKVENLKDTAKYITDLEEILAENSVKTLPEQPKVKVYNTVTTPSGERAAMVLPDGSKVYLTSNSYLRYPTQFDRSKREVTLVGRAYFEVKKSSVPFVVNTSDMNIEVLGTSFDVESRYSAQNTSVILVEGSVKVQADGKTRIIYPDEQISLHRLTREMTVKNVDSKLLTMWKDGVLIVHGQSFDELIENLSSWYGVEIVDLTTVSELEKFNGRFDREDIQVAIEAVSISAKIQYSVHEGKLILEDR